MRTPKTSRIPFYSRTRRENTPHYPQTQAYRQLNKAAEFAGVEHVGNHTLRKTFGYWFYKATKDIAMLKRILNHQSFRYPEKEIQKANKEVEKHGKEIEKVKLKLRLLNQ
ncbi:tyrosine-type recombinase/integrase [Peribacillus sp. NJ4]|uniref:tyrosine-type recombinase/integrase n=1 Tax=Peribacillus sp. NJ4 TaxID=3055862 RepID=UPI0025A2CBBD|nr:tyrosine-type recombinase/integrase [Peribacillus sp. NJ4]MDM5214629.1 tyrosine-type recombinase/integrase [Peribacillus sp. NJ4]